MIETSRSTDQLKKTDFKKRLQQGVNEVLYAIRRRVTPNTVDYDPLTARRLEHDILACSRPGLIIEAIPDSGLREKIWRLIDGASVTNPKGVQQLSVFLETQPREVQERVRLWFRRQNVDAFDCDW